MAGWYGPKLNHATFEAMNTLRIAKGEPLPGIAWERNAAVTMSLTREVSRARRKAFARARLSDGVAFPIVTDSGIIGIAEFYARSPIALDSIADALASIGAHTGLFIERRREETAHRETAVRLQSLLDSVGDGIITFDEGGAIESANHAAGKLFGFPAEQLTRMTVDALLAPAQRGGVGPRLERGALEWETEGLRCDGTTFPMDFRASEMRLGDARLFIGTLRDTSELKARTLALQHQALHDSLTGLPNRVLLTDRLAQAINTGARSGRPVSLLLMDMDGFKEVNDTLGHHSGDMLLRQVAERLRSTLRAEDTVARLGGDEFAILPAGACDEHVAMHVAEKVLTALQAPFLIDEQSIHARMSIGVAVYPTHGDDAETLMRRADVAMYTAKRMRSGRVAYSPAQDEHSKRRLQLTGELRRAIPASELVLHYQPRLHLPTNTVTAVEALVRWQHPEQGLVPPSEFIPVAEQSDLIHPLTAWVAGEAVRQLRVFAELGFDLNVAINVSARNLADQQLPSMIAALLRQWGVGASRLRLEMTESVVMASDWQEVLTQLHQLGLSVAIDDFGVGYSSLAYLQRLPVDEIKIDKSFVGDMVHNADNAAIVRSTIELGHNLGLKVVAEGVETQECLDMLTSFGCDAAQGFLVSHPLAIDDLVGYFAERSGRELLTQRSA
jgi:diguanylate cyclase (GGDEF)-like protein/PAS domain S-box-containing protein